MEIEVEAVKKRDYKGEDEAAKGTHQIRMLRRRLDEKVDDPEDAMEMEQLSCESVEMGKTDSDAVAGDDGQRMKETEKDPDVEESGAAMKDNVKGEGKAAAAKIADEKMREKYLEWKRKKEAEERERVWDPDELTDRYAFVQKEVGRYLCEALR